MGEASGSGAGGEEGEGAAAEAETEHKEYPCLLRATDGKGKQSKVKISTLVSRSAPFCAGGSGRALFGELHQDRSLWLCSLQV